MIIAVVGTPFNTIAGFHQNAYDPKPRDKSHNVCMYTFYMDYSALRWRVRFNVFFPHFFLATRYKTKL